MKKYTDSQLYPLLRHNGRDHSTYSNIDIDSQKTPLNYSIPIDHNGLSPVQYYQKILDESYIYGRGTSREKKTITAVSWIITLPEELLGNKEQETIFFQTVHDFLLYRYKYLIRSDIHYDEAGLPHIHALIIPVTHLDHEKIHYKTVKTKNAIQTPSGRYEYSYRFKLDETGNKIPVKNYAKISDFYDQKIDANTVLNRIELVNFHRDLQQYLINHKISGKVLTGTTGGTNFSVQELKEFTANTGLTLDQLKETMTHTNILESYADKVTEIKTLKHTILEKNKEIDFLQNKIIELQNGVQEYDQNKKLQSWEHTDSWGNSGWDSQKIIHFEEE